MKNNIVAEVEISNPDKIIFQKQNIKKIDIAKFYADVAERMLPYLENRLLSVIRCHQGTNENCFFKKHPTTERSNIEIFNCDGEEYFYIKTKKQLVYQAQMGTIEFHPWGSCVPKIDKPNLMVFDLDPEENLPVETLRSGVKNLKQVLKQLNLTSFLKTSGGKGYHVVVPFSSCQNWEKFNNFAKQVALLLESQFPKLYTTNIRKCERKSKIFIDWLRNSKGATCVAPYSLRVRESATISFPISWKDIDKITPNEINILNYKKYLKTDPWQDFFKVKQKII